ncbi:hypothetical protein DM02DRAFT_630405 [Periconia macrospinosa]|uniref:Rhodopsin domain-containing protein n=1 Tax=Periconia macrospinosa TaxID=97972 RepID=A0A2V1DJD6_9PLEO|nr:hypothetical protein DM02DRAFT_630405 [Periconia macrospinosa]
MAVPTDISQASKEYLEEYIGHRLMIVASVFIALNTIFMILFYASRYLAKTLEGWDAYFLVPAGYILNIGLCVCSILAIKIGGAGYHALRVERDDPNKLVVRTKIQKAAELIDFAAITASKLAILALYLKIFALRQYRIATYVVGVIVLVTWLGALVGSMTICKPLAYQWDKSIPGGRCGNLIRGYQIIGIPNLLSDVLIMVIPIPAIWKLQMEMATKIGLVATFLIGSAGTITCIIRVVTFFQSDTLLTDATYMCVITFSILIAEAGTYFIAACMPHLRYLKRRVFPEQSFTKLVDTTIKKLPVKAEASHGVTMGSGSAPKGQIKVTRTTQISVSEGRITGTEPVHGVDFEMQDRAPRESEEYSKV